MIFERYWTNTHSCCVLLSPVGDDMTIRNLQVMIQPFGFRVTPEDNVQEFVGSTTRNSK